MTGKQISNGINESNWMIIHGIKVVTIPKIAVFDTNPTMILTEFALEVYPTV